MPDTNRDIFLPTTHSEMEGRGWDELDVILITGDAYVDHPSYGAAVIGRVLEDAGFRTGIIAQPDWKKTADFKKLGRPKLFFGITAGNLDSALSNYTPARKIRHKDYYSPGGRSGLRPNLATVVYANKVREAWPGAPVVIGGIEASLRRLAHYSYWDDSVRRSILLDAKADILVYGMGERQTVEIAKRIRDGEDIKHLDGIPGTVVARSAHLQIPKSVTLPSYEEVRKDPVKFNEAFKLSYYECDAVRGRPVVQPHADRSIIQYPPPLPLKTAEIDHLYDLPFTRRWHPCYDVEGGVPGFEVVRFSITSHRGCSAECNFCSLYAHQGRIIQSRSHDSILREVKRIAALAEFKGTITDIGGPTANLYAASCHVWDKAGACRAKDCLVPEKCSHLKLGYDDTLELWKKVMKVPGVKHLFISSGLRYDLLCGEESGAYLNALCSQHVSGHLKVAPEHESEAVLGLMKKAPYASFETFGRRFDEANRKAGKKQFLVNYYISAHPGATLQDAAMLGVSLAEKGVQPEQIQDYLPIPMTVSSCMYHTGMHPFTGEKLYVARTEKERNMQRAFLQYRIPKNKKLIREALEIIGRPDLMKHFSKGHSYGR